jgi:pseudouridine-5'-phosphate glycosidase
VLDAQFQLHGAGVVIGNPVAAENQLDPALHERVLEAGLAAVRERSIMGKAITPFLLEFFRTETGGASLRVNLNLVRANTRLATHIAAALVGDNPGRHG